MLFMLMWKAQIKKKKVQSKELFGISQVQSEILKILSP